MTQFVKSLRTRIEEISASVEAQTSELAAYRQLLELELAHESKQTKGPSNGARPQTRIVTTASAPHGGMAEIPFAGNKTALVAELVRGHGKAGASPKELEQVFEARKIERSKNLIYNTLSYLVGQHKLERRDGRYFAVSTAAVTQNGSAPSKTPNGKRLSPEGLKGIREGIKKRWAAKNAAK